MEGVKGEVPQVARLAKLEHDLEAEFSGRIPPDRIHELTREAFRAFDDARIRDFVEVLAWRRARDGLRAAL